MNYNLYSSLPFTKYSNTQAHAHTSHLIFTAAVYGGTEDWGSRFILFYCILFIMYWGNSHFTGKESEAQGENSHSRSAAKGLLLLRWF